MKNSITLLLLFVVTTTLQAQTFIWTEQNTNTTSTLRNVFFNDSETGWAVGDNGTILHTTNGGNTWSSINNITTEKLYAVHFTGSMEGWICGGSSNPIILKTEDGGNTWTDKTPSGLASVIIFDIAFETPQLGWFITFNKVYMTTDGGDTWVEESYQPGVEGENHTALAVTSDSVAHIASRTTNMSTGRGEVYHRELAPLNYWAESTISDFSSDDPQLTSIDFPSKDLGYCAGEAGIIYRFTPNVPGIYSGPWDIIYDLQPASGTEIIPDIDFANNSTGTFISHTEINSITHALIHSTADSGNSWSVPDTIANFFGRAMHYISPDTIYVVGLNGKLYKGTTNLNTSVNSSISDNPISIYPNPTNNQVFIESAINKTTTYYIRNLAGVVISQGTFQTNTSIELQHFAPGMYLITLAYDNKTTTQRLIKK